jgi:hypothetical protein
MRMRDQFARCRIVPVALDVGSDQMGGLDADILLPATYLVANTVTSMGTASSNSVALVAGTNSPLAALHKYGSYWMFISARSPSLGW